MTNSDALGDFSDEVLQEELEGRALAKKLSVIPKPLDIRDFSDVASLTASVVREAVEFECINGSDMRDVFLAAVAAVYGEEFSTWLRMRDW